MFHPTFLLTLAFVLLACSNVFGGEGRIAMRVLDRSGATTPARGWVDARGEDGKRVRLFQPESPATVTPYARDKSFSCDGTFTILVPEGDATVHLEKGKEYRPVELKVNVPADQTVRVSVQMERWVNLPESGWYSADMHVHLGQDDPRVLAQLALADDVHLIPAFTYWLRGRGEEWKTRWPDESYLEPISVDPTHVITRNNIEIERIDGRAAPGASIGATFLFNLNRSVTAERYGEHFPTDAELCRVARGHSPNSVYDSDKPSWAETVIGAALGGLDTIQLCHNHYHRSQTLLGGYGMIGPLDAGESNAAVGDGLFHRTNRLYYRFLNCGFRFGVSGGSAIGVMAVPAGYNRVYAHIDGPLTAEKMWASIKAGQTFVTSGPMLTLSADGRPIGSTIDISSTSAAPIRVATSVRSIERLESLQIVLDGRVVATKDLINQSLDRILEAALETRFAPKRSGWLAARAYYRAPDGLLRQAHTSPIYVVVDGKPTASARDAKYMLRWIDELSRIAERPNRFPDEKAQKVVTSVYQEARDVYEEIIRHAQQHWGDQ